MGQITLLNKHTLLCDDPTAIYIGRGSPLGNPYRVEDYGRDDAIKMYDVWLDEQIRKDNQPVLRELDRIANEVLDHGYAKLLCFCAPKACHGNVIKRVVLNQIAAYESSRLIYAGIGSRETPYPILEQMTSIAKQLSGKWLLRSGYAEGADQAFHLGVLQGKGDFETFIPWNGFNNAPRNDRRFVVPEFNERLEALSQRHHPAWDNCSDGAKKLHMRNACQIFGRDLDRPAKMVICWTPEGKGKGGTGQALRIARENYIPIFDLALPNAGRSLCEFVEQVEAE